MITFDEIVNMNLDLLDLLIKKYGYTEKGWEIFTRYYRDPDAFPIDKKGYRKVNGVVCTADALISVNRIYEQDGFNERTREIYAFCREVPIFFFPREKGGINTMRYSVFGDRIDHTLLDIQRYCKGAEDCKLKKAYLQPKTKKWFESFDYDFKRICEWLNINHLFVEIIGNDVFIYDLEIGDCFLEKYADRYSKKWSRYYYENVQKKIALYKERASGKI